MSYFELLHFYRWASNIVLRTPWGRLEPWHKGPSFRPPLSAGGLTVRADSKKLMALPLLFYYFYFYFYLFGPAIQHGNPNSACTVGELGNPFQQDR